MRLGALFVVIATLSSAATLAAVSLGYPFAWLGLWPATAFFVVGVGYLRFGARVFGKRDDGTIPLSTRLLLLPYLLVAWGIWSLIRLGPERCWDRVAPGVYLGRRPYPRELPQDVTLVVDLTSEFARSIPKSSPLEYLCLPILDASMPSVSELHALVGRVAAHAGPVYIHCAQGHGRSAVVAGALLVSRGIARDALEAESLMKSIRPGVHMSRLQRDRLAAVTTLVQGSSLPSREPRDC